MKTLKQIREASGGKEAYQKFFNATLKKFGVDSPAELDDAKKKEFFDAIDKGWDGGDEPKEKGESVKEAKLKGGRGKAEIDINWDGDAKDVKFAATKYKIKIKPHRDGAMLSGDKQKILAYLQGQDYAMDDEDIEDLYPEVLEAKVKPPKLGDKEEYYRRVDKVDAKFKIGYGKGKRSMTDLSSSELKKYFAARDAALGHTLEDVKEASRYSRDLRGPAKEIFNKTLELIRKEKIRGDKDQAAAIDRIDGAQHLNGRDKRTIIMALQYESVHTEEAPPGMEDFVKKLKADGIADEEAFAIAWSAYNKEKNRKRNYHDEKVKTVGSIKGKLGKTYPVMDASQKKKVEKIAKANSGNMQKAIKLIDRIRKNLSDNPDVMDILKKANENTEEAVDCDARLLGFKAATRRREGEMQKGKVIVDRRTRGYKDARVRAETAKAKREADATARKKKAFNEKYPKLDYGYLDDAEMQEIIKGANSKILYGETASNAVANSGVDMAPNAGKKKKKMIKRNY